MFVAHYKHIVSTGRKIASPLLAIIVAVSFFATWAHIAGAANSRTSVMPCCVGKEAGHCDSGLTAHKPAPPPSEPMCGLESISLDAITIVAEPSATSHQTGTSAESETHAETEVSTRSHSLGKPCPMSCGACTASASRLQKRQKDPIPAKRSTGPAPRARLRFENTSRVFPSSELRTSISLRGPPATSL